MVKQSAELVYFNKFTKNQAEGKGGKGGKKEIKSNRDMSSISVEKQDVSHSISSPKPTKKRQSFTSNHDTFVPFLTVSIVTGEILYDNRKNVYWTLKE